MNNPIEFNQKQLTLLITNLLCAKMVFAFPRYLFETSGNAAWLQAIYMSLIALILVGLSVATYRFTGRKSIIQLSESVGGMPLKIIISLLTALCFSASLCTETRVFTESVKLILLPKTKVEYVMLLFALTVVIGAFAGLNSLGTVNAIFFPFCLIFLGILGISLIQYCRISALMPLWGTGKTRIFADGLSDMSCFSDILALNILLPHCRNIETAKKSARRSILIAGAAITLICLIYGMIYPYPFTSEFLLTVYQLSRMVRAGEYFQRFEALFEFIWTITHLLYSSIYLYLIADVLGDGFKIKDKSAAIPCIAAIICFAASEPNSVAELLEGSKQISQYLAPAAYFLPIIIPLIYAVKRRLRHEI